jgi:type I restriction enzyme S subunit
MQRKHQESQGKPWLFCFSWEQRKLSEVAQITMGQSPDGSTYCETPNDYILVQGNADLKDGWVSPRIWTTQKTKTADAGDLIMSVRAPAGAMGKTAYNVVLGRGVAGIKGNEFLYQTLVKMDNDGYWKKLAAGSTFESINSDAINNAVIAVPQDIDEQRRIGDYLQGLDNLITLHQRFEFSLSSAFRKNALSWEQRKFSDFVQRESAFRVSSSEYPSVEYEDVVAEEGRLNKDVRKKETQKTGIIFDGTQVLYGKLRPYLHNWLNPDFSGIAVGDWWVLRPVGVDKKFLYRLIQTQQFDEVANQSSGSKMPRADWNLVSNTEFTIPSSLDEQRQVAETFEDLDNLITLHQRENWYLYRVGYLLGTA